MRKTIDRLLNPDLMSERIESLKAGLFAALTAVCTYWLMTLLVYLISQTQYNYYLQDLSFVSRLKIEYALFDSAFAISSGFLFGATYRYVVRNDTNPHLQSGAIAAFALVRAMAQLEVHLPNLYLSNFSLIPENQIHHILTISMGATISVWLQGLNFPLIALIFGESFAWFAAAGFILDVTMKLGWVKRFVGENK